MYPFVKLKLEKQAKEFFSYNDFEEDFEDFMSKNIKSAKVLLQMK